MTLFSIFVSALAVGLSGAMAPGSLLVADVQASIREGYRGWFKLVAGHAGVELTMTLLLVYGLSRFLAMDAVTAAISLIGATVLLWLGYITIRDALANKYLLDLKTTTDSAFGSATLGIVATISNPFWLLWWATIGSGYVLLSQRQAGFPGLVSFYLGHISADFFWYFLITLTIVSGRKFISPVVYRNLLLICGVFLLLLALCFIYSGFGLLY